MNNFNTDLALESLIKNIRIIEKKDSSIPKFKNQYLENQYLEITLNKNQIPESIFRKTPQIMKKPKLHYFNKILNHSGHKGIFIDIYN